MINVLLVISNCGKHKDIVIEFVLVFVDAPWLFLTLYIVYISFYVIWTDMCENKLFVIVIVIVINIANVVILLAKSNIYNSKKNAMQSK